MVERRKTIKEAIRRFGGSLRRRKVDKTPPVESKSMQLFEPSTDIYFENQENFHDESGLQGKKRDISVMSEGEWLIDDIFESYMMRSPSLLDGEKPLELDLFNDDTIEDAVIDVTTPPVPETRRRKRYVSFFTLPLPKVRNKKPPSPPTMSDAQEESELADEYPSLMARIKRGIIKKRSYSLVDNGISYIDTKFSIRKYFNI